MAPPSAGPKSGRGGVLSWSPLSRERLSSTRNCKTQPQEDYKSRQQQDQNMRSAIVQTRINIASKHSHVNAPDASCVSWCLVFRIAPHTHGVAEE